MDDVEFAYTKIAATNQRGVKVVLINNTSVRFLLLDARLESGSDWVAQIPLEVLPHATIKFACVSNAFLTGVAGRALFASAGRDQSFKVTWTNPFSFFSSSEVTASASAELDATVGFSCSPHSAGYYLHGRVEINKSSSAPASPSCSPTISKRTPSKESSTYENMIRAFIRPARHRYSLEDLGPQKFSLFGSLLCERVDLEILSKHNKKLQCSWFRRIDLPDSARPCVVYCHANSGSRCFAKQTVSLMLPFGISVFAFDFGGSGMSEGEYVTLGAREQSDLESVVSCLRQNHRDKVSRIALWGRSMGAVASLLYARTDPRISALVCDSPFSDLRLLVQQLVQGGGSSMPSLVIDGALYIISGAIEKRCGMNLVETCNPIRDVPYMRIPLLLLHGTLDKDVPVMHSEAIFNNYGSTDKTLLKIEQGHNSRRPAETNDQIARFLAFRLTGNLQDYRALLVNSIKDETNADIEEDDDQSLLPCGWSKME